jgi:phage terminase large subunit-like protein
MMSRFWLPESAVTFLDGLTNGRVSQRADGGWITVTPGDVIDNDVIYADIAADCATFKVMAAGHDEWSGEPA